MGQKLSRKEKRARFLDSLPSRVERARKKSRAADYVHSLLLSGHPCGEAAQDLLFLPERVRLTEMQKRRQERVEEGRQLHALDLERAAEREAKRRSDMDLLIQDVETAKRSKFSLAELRKAGLSGKHVAEIADWRRGSVTCGKAAAYLGIPKGRLQRWISTGAIKPSFFRRAAVTGAGTVLAGMWRLEDLDALARRLDGVEFQSTLTRLAKKHS